jgi:hypothetical protein
VKDYTGVMLLSVKRGVPRGSVSSSLLFLLYVNDIHGAPKQNNINLFADDTQLLVFGSNAVELSNAATLLMNS